jgi:hypothetical protein
VLTTDSQFQSSKTYFTYNTTEQKYERFEGYEFEDGVNYYEQFTGLNYDASGMWETLEIEPSNRWIQIGGSLDTSNGKNKTLTIGHGTHGTTEQIAQSTLQRYVLTEDTVCDEDKTYYTYDNGLYTEFTGTTFETDTDYYEFSTEDFDTEGEEPTQLVSGDILTIPITEYDNAGHLSAEPSYSYLKIPTTTINIGDNTDIIPDIDDDKLKFEGDSQWIKLEKNTTTDALSFKHASLDKDDLDSSEYTSFNTFIYKNSAKTSMSKEDALT